MRIHGVPDPSCPDCRYDGHYATCTAWAERHGRPETRADMTPDNPADRRLTLAEFVVARIFAREAGYRPGDPDRVLAECAVQRRMVDRYKDAIRFYREENQQGRYAMVALARMTEANEWMMLLAQSWADHPDFNEAWAPKL